MATTTQDRTGTDEQRPAGAPPAPGAERKERFRLPDMYIERRDGPVTMAERCRAALTDLVVAPVFFAVVAAIQAWGRDRAVETSWVVTAAVVTVALAVLGFAFPRFSPNGYAHLRGTDWSKESTASKVVGIIAMLALVALLVWRAVYRMD